MGRLSARILIAYDEAHVRQLLRDFLAGRGYEVATAATSRQTLDAVGDFRPDVILVDVLLSVRTAPDLLHALQHAGVGAPVVLICGNEHVERERVFGVLEKPFDLRLLGEVVAAAVDYARTRTVPVRLRTGPAT